MANEIVRMLPNDIEAEQAILGSLIIDKDAIATVLETINTEDFYREDNKEIFFRSSCCCYHSPVRQYSLCGGTFAASGIF